MKKLFFLLVITTVLICSSTFGQSQTQNNTNSKYAVFENLGQQYPQSNGMFYGMNMNGTGYNQPQPQPQNVQTFDF